MKESLYILLLVFLTNAHIHARDGIDDAAGWGTWKASVTDGACILRINYIDESKQRLDGISFYFIQRHVKEKYPSEFSNTDFGIEKPSLVAYQYPWAILDEYPPEIDSISFDKSDLTKIPTTRVALFALDGDATEKVIKSMNKSRSFDVQIEHANMGSMDLTVRGYNYGVAKPMFDACNEGMSKHGSYEKTASTTQGVVPRRGLVPY